MKKIGTILILFIGIIATAQSKDEKANSVKVLKNLSEKACKCLDSISSLNKTDPELNTEIESCIDKQVMALQISKKMEEATKKIETEKNVNVEINFNKESEQYKDAYYKIESDLFDHCSRMKDLLSASDFHDDSMTKNAKAISFYNAGISASKKEDLESAIKNYENAVKEDPNFSYAWDNLGLCYRKINEYDKALNAYQNSLKSNPKGRMPLQNIAIVYTYKKEYQKAIDAFKTFDEYYPGDPEVYYGIGHIYYEYLKEYEKSLDYMCKAYNIYTDTKSPYRNDAQTIIVSLYHQLKAENKVESFKKIMTANNITFSE